MLSCAFRFRSRLLLAAAALFSWPALATPEPGLPNPPGVPLDPVPRVVDVSPVAPDVLALRVQEGELRGHELLPYVRDPEDRVIEERAHGLVTGRRVERGAAVLGYLSGPDGQTLLRLDHYVGDAIAVARVDEARSYLFQSDEDERFTTARAPAWVSRKTKPNLFARRQHTVGALHTIYLGVGEALREGATYELDLRALGFRQLVVRYHHDPAAVRSEAVHVNQNGFAPGDATKCAYVSLWLGARGGYRFSEELRYHVVDEVKGTRVWSGTAGVHWPADRPERMYREANHVGADVYRLDFAGVTAAGRYHVYVEGVGRSESFAIRADAWRQAAVTSLRGLYHHRSGIALTTPHTDFWRPRPHHPADGVVIRQSRATLLDTTMGLNVRNRDSFRALVEEATEEVLPDAWGGMMDAGDWDRRAQHLVIPRLLLELYELAPAYFDRLSLNIPESGNALPDMVDEALWILDFYVRLQTPEGGVRGGVESAEHPVKGDVSWAETIPVYAYAPDFWSTHEFVATAARAATVLRGRWPERAAVYAEAAARGLAWAEREYAAWRQDPSVPRRPPEVRDARNLAALEMYRMTGDDRWHQIYLEDSVLADESATAEPAQRDAVFGYARLPATLGQAELRARARALLLADADAARHFQQENAFGLTAVSRRRPPFLGFYSGAVDASALVRGHVLTGEEAYRTALQQACQFGFGANPDNLSYTTGIGVRQPKWVLHEDALKTGRRAPPGITVYGPFDHSGAFNAESDWWFVGFRDFRIEPHKMQPPLVEWPVLESYVDMWNFLAQNEYTPWQTMAPAAYVWAYLAAQTPE